MGIQNVIIHTEFSLIMTTSHSKKCPYESFLAKKKCAVKLMVMNELKVSY